MARSSLPSLRRSILAARRSLAALDQSLKRLADSLLAEGGVPTARTHTKSRAKYSPKALASLKLHGQYIGYMRQLKPKQKDLVRAIKAKNGTKAAIRKAQMLAGKGKAS